MEGKINETKRMSSIAWKLQWRNFRSKVSIYFKMDLFLYMLLFVVWVMQKEWNHVGSFSYYFVRKIHSDTDITGLTYTVTDRDGKLVYSLLLYPMVKWLGMFVGGLFLFHFLCCLLSIDHERRKIKKILAPINEIALRVDELSQFAFSEDKYQLIEDAISSVSPKDEEMLSFGDSELQGIEVAMNNLLKRMRETYQQQARFVNDASHELRTPIAVMEGYINMIARWGRQDEKVLDESIHALQRESGHMKKLVEQLLFLARGDSGKNRLELKETSLKECMQEIYEESLLIDEEHIYRYHPTEDVVVQADPQMLKQAVRVLVDNAAKYTDVNDEILLAIGRNGEGRPYLQVQDTGIGMASADVEHMFERFYRADEARKYKGTGLGLSIAKWIVDKHGGHFEILSRTELGTRIRIVL